jgi:hypothetical protein
VKIAACLGVKDEVSLVRAAIDHLRAIGVDHIIASDAYSTDGTEVILAEFAKGPDFDLTHFDDRATAATDEEAVTIEMFDRSRAVGADWLLFCDADEFPMPRGGSLRGVAGLSTADALIVPRFNVPLLPTGPTLPLGALHLRPEDLLVYAPDENRASTQSRVRQDNTKPWIASVPGPKVMARTSTIKTLAEGHHNIVAADGGAVITQVPADLFIAHLPFSTVERFAHKVANIRAVVEATGETWGPDSAWHWHRWLKNIDEMGGVAGEMERNTISPTLLAELRQSGVVRSAPEVWDHSGLGLPR